MSDDVDPIIVAGDDGMVLDESSESEDDRATLDEFGIVATDGGEPVDDVQDESTDGPVMCREDGDGLAIHVDPDSELGERLSWIAGHRGLSADELLAEALRDQLDLDRELWGDERLGVDDRTTACEHCGERFDVTETHGTFDGDVARYACPNCGEGTEGPLPEGR